MSKVMVRKWSESAGTCLNQLQRPKPKPPIKSSDGPSPWLSYSTLTPRVSISGIALPPLSFTLSSTGRPARGCLCYVGLTPRLKSRHRGERGLPYSPIPYPRSGTFQAISGICHYFVTNFLAGVLGSLYVVKYE